MRETPAEVSRHKCLIYDGHPSEQLPVIVPLLADGLRERDRCLYLGSPEMTRMVAEALAARGVDVAEAQGRGALVFSSDRSHLDGGFDPAGMVGMLRGLVADAVRDGFRGLCATGDMRWELGSDAHMERLLEYEALLESAFRDLPLRGICQYHRASLPPRAVRDALLTHRSIYVGAELNRDNLFYIPPELHVDGLGPLSRDRQGEWLCRQIVRISEAERRRDEAIAALRASEADLERRVRERTAELEALNADLEAFTFTVTHDLRAPLRHMDGFSGMLRERLEGRLDPESADLLAEVRSASARMSVLIERLLLLCRASRGELAKGEVDLSALARGAARELGLECAVQDGLSARGDRELLRTVFENLLGNALKFARPGTAPRAEFGRAAEGEFFVRDDGLGFPPDQAGRLFAPFTRLRADVPGSGIGLSSVKRIIERHGGRIRAEGRPGKGAAFYFTLPSA